LNIKLVKNVKKSLGLGWLEMSELREVPHSDIDLQMQMTNPEWGHKVPQELKDKLTKIKGYSPSDDGKSYTVIKEELWGLLSFYTRDVRLGNLNVFLGETEYCRYYLDLASDLLREDYIDPFLTCLSRVVSVLELSQSRGGFLRRQNNTIRQEHSREEKEPKKRNLFGGSKNNGD